MKQKLQRCPWVSNNIEYIKYHDTEWGVPEHQEKKLFEMLILESMQAGLSWLIILLKRKNYRKLLDNFDYKKISCYDENKISKLLENKGIIRNKLKIISIVNNARAFINIQSKYGSFNKYIWGFVDHDNITNKNKKLLSEIISKELKKEGFNFVGPKICYSFMESIGIFNNHSEECFRYKEVEEINVI